MTTHKSTSKIIKPKNLLEQDLPNLPLGSGYLFSIYDLDSKIFLSPMLFPTLGACIRYIKQFKITSKDSLFVLFPNKYKLTFAGSFSSSDGSCCASDEYTHEFIDIPFDVIFNYEDKQ